MRTTMRSLWSEISATTLRAHLSCWLWRNVLDVDRAAGIQTRERDTLDEYGFARGRMARQTCDALSIVL